MTNFHLVAYATTEGDLYAATKLPTFFSLPVSGPIEIFIDSADTTLSIGDTLDSVTGGSGTSLDLPITGITYEYIRINGTNYPVALISVSEAEVMVVPLNLTNGTVANFALPVGNYSIGSTLAQTSFTLFDTFGHVNSAPNAVNDSYTTDAGVALVVTAALGVLGNDSDPDLDSLAASLVSGPSHGTVTLASNGSFTYTPTSGYSGADQFTYRASDGNGGTDTATVSLTVTAASGGGGLNTITGTSGNDTLIGTSGNDEIIGLGGNDRIEAGAGDDVINAGTGQDWNVYGGAGADTFVLARGDNRVYIRDFQDGIDKIEFTGDVTFADLTIEASTSNGTARILIGSDIFTVAMPNPNALTEADFIFGGGSGGGGGDLNTITGTSGNDTLIGTSDNDEILGYAGNDRIEAGAGDDVINAGTGQDWNVYGGSGADTFVLAQGDNRVYIRDFQDGIDKIEFTGGVTFADLTIQASTSNGTARILIGSDIFTVAMPNPNALTEADFIFGGGSGGGGGGVTTITGTSGNDTLTGTSGDNVILGYAGNDRIEAGAGDDIINAGSGQDWNVYGGTGADTFQISNGDNRVFIRDFVDGTDKIELLGGLTFADLTITLDTTNSRAKLTYNAGADQVTVETNNISAFGFDDFL